MFAHKPHSKQKFSAMRPVEKGFVLISSIIVMALLLVIAIASMSLSSISTQSSMHTSHQARAEANARMALFVAIAELQKHSGNDQVVTGRADLLDPDPQIDSKQKVRNGRYTLAFQTQPANGDYNQAKYGNGIFLREASGLPAVLVSGNEHFDITDASLATYPAGYTTQDSPFDERFITIFGQTMRAEDQVRVPRVKLEINNAKGSYAYWISGENTKARVNISDTFKSQNSALADDHSAVEERFHSLNAPASPGLKWAGSSELGSEGFLYGLSEKPGLNQQVLSQNTLALTTPDDIKLAVQRHFHDFTTTSYTVLSNAKHGGLKKNLTAALNLTDNNFQDLINHQGEEAAKKDPVFLYQNYSFPNSQAKVDYLHYPGSVWGVFRSYLRGPEYEPDLKGKAPAILAHLGGKAHKISHYWEAGKASSNQLRSRLIRRTPIMQRLQVAIDYSLGYNGVIEDAEGKWHEFSMRQHFIPTVSYWNPYNVTLTTADTHTYKIFNSRDYGSHQHHSTFRADFLGQPEWKVLAMIDRNAPIAWSEVKNSASTFVFPFHPTGGVAGAKYQKTNYGVKIRPFTIPPGETATFALTEQNRPLDYNSKNYLSKVTDSTAAVGYSFYVKTAKFRVKIENNLSMEDATPELELLRYPSSGGDSLTRLSVTNSTTFQQTNLNFGSVTSRAGIIFTPTIIKDADRLPSADANGTESPKFAGVILRKSVDFSHYYPNGLSWEKHTTGYDTNPYNAPFHALYNPLASRQSAYGRTIGTRHFTFTAPFMYLAGVIVSKTDYNLVSPQMTKDGKIFVGYSDTINGGSNKAILFSIPRYESRLTTIAQLNKMDQSKWLSGYNSNQDFASVTDSVMQVNAIGNSFASPHIAPDQSSVNAYDSSSYGGQKNHDFYATQYDSSFHYNEALWDRYFLTGERAGEVTTVDEVKTKLPNQNLVTTPHAEIDKHLNPHESASQLLLKGGFNVNSTSVEAWKAILSSTIGLRTSAKDTSDSSLVPFPKTAYTEATALSSPPTDVTDTSLYDGSTYRALTENEITQLAQHIVAENKLRGPYFTLSQFVNRSLDPALHYRHARLSDTLSHEQVSYEGALQAAINHTGINGVLNTPVSNYPAEIVVDQELSPQTGGTKYSDYERGKINPRAIKYHPGFGYASTLTQADVLSRIGHLLTVRSDTFQIRAYGESKDDSGSVVATAYCEAIVQRNPEWTNPADASSTPPMQWELTDTHIGKWSPNTELSEHSRRYGRRYTITSFRWLSREEI